MVLLHVLSCGGRRDSTWDAGLVELAKYGDYVWHDRIPTVFKKLVKKDKDVVVTL
ncbi:MAG: hypothetical protein IPN15_17860 [Saprospiraceae bacterium]|nr:hypothetical protein [Candidatus Vicinibacter affinis]